MTGSKVHELSPKETMLLSEVLLNPVDYAHFLADNDMGMMVLSVETFDNGTFKTSFREPTSFPCIAIVNRDNDYETKFVHLQDFKTTDS